MSCDHLDDLALLAAFEALAIAPADFGHRDHLRVAFAMLAREGDLAAAAHAFRTALRRFVAAIGATARYHETLTWAYLALIAERMARRAFASSHELLEANPDLLDHAHGALARSYDVEAITRSELARRVFVLPTRS